MLFDAKKSIPDLKGMHAVIIGRSNIVGKPMAQLLLEESCTVTIVHSKTKNIEEITKQADIVVAAVGRPLMVKKDWIKEGAVVIDVGINRVGQIKVKRLAVKTIVNTPRSNLDSEVGYDLLKSKLTVITNYTSEVLKPIDRKSVV